MRVKCLAQEHNTMTPATVITLRPRPSHLDICVQTHSNYRDISLPIYAIILRCVVAACLETFDFLLATVEIVLCFTSICLENVLLTR